MARMKKNPGARLARRATRRTSLHGRRPILKKQVFIWGAACLVTVIAALVWGNYLKAESEALRLAESAGEWSLDTEIAIPLPVDAPEFHAGFAAPTQKMQTTQKLDYDAATFDLGSCVSPLPYAVELPSASGMTVSDGAPALSAETGRFHRANLSVVGVFTVVSLEAESKAEEQLLRGMEMSLLTLYAEAGIDSFLLLGLPQNAATAQAYLTEVKALLASIAPSVSVGVALLPNAFEGEAAIDTADTTDGSVYAGNPFPGQILAVCDYLALDLRNCQDPDAILAYVSYAYMRYSLRLLTPLERPEVAAAAIGHGFGRIWEYKSA